MFVTSLGHSGILIEDTAASILIDPWPQSPKTTDVTWGASPDLILLTHGHADHLGVSVDVAREKNVPIVAVPELAAYCRAQGVQAELINFGGSFATDSCVVKCVPALHSSSVGEDRKYAGNPCGFIVRLQDGCVYHSGDTCLFSDMKLIGDHHLDVAILPIGGRTTMDPEEALNAIPLLRPKFVVPIHVNTWDFIEQDVDKFCEQVDAETDAEAVQIEPGERAEFEM